MRFNSLSKEKKEVCRNVIASPFRYMSRIILRLNLKVQVLLALGVSLNFKSF